MEVKYAVIPCAGKGTRFLPITKGVAKELCPIIDRPTLDFIVEECIDGGCTDIVFIVSKDKEDIKKFYSRDLEFEKFLIDNGKKEQAEMIKQIAEKARFHYVIQEEQLGLGHAVLQAKKVIGDNNFVVCCGDDIAMYDGVSPVKQLIDCFVENGGHTVVGGKKVDHNMINKYGCMDLKEQISERAFKLKGIVEKPKLEEAPSDYASLGKWVFNGRIFDYLEKTPRGTGNEIQLTDAIALEMKDHDVYYYDFDGTRYDCGDKFGYITAIIYTALKREEFRDKLKAYLKSLDL